MLAFNCPNCLAGFNVADEAAGKSASCPKCKAKVTVPDALELSAQPAPRPMTAQQPVQTINVNAKDKTGTPLAGLAAVGGLVAMGFSLASTPSTAAVVALVAGLFAIFVWIMSLFNALRGFIASGIGIGLCVAAIFISAGKMGAEARTKANQNYTNQQK